MKFSYIILCFGFSYSPNFELVYCDGLSWVRDWDEWHHTFKVREVQEWSVPERAEFK